MRETEAEIRTVASVGGRVTSSLAYGGLYRGAVAASRWPSSRGMGLAAGDDECMPLTLTEITCRSAELGGAFDATVSMPHFSISRHPLRR